LDIEQEDPMETGRRFFLSSVFPGIAAVLGGSNFLKELPQRQMPQGQRGQFPEIPDASASGRHNDDIPTQPPPDPKVLLQENQKNLRRDVDHLVELTKDLKVEADKTEQTDVLSLSLVKKAEEIEKLARHIKDLARGS
jgi:hypothetical protein